jgi:anaerobic nitric oxide reductase flavorubredoxin
VKLYAQAIKYYANILTPFSRLVKKKIEEVLALNLPVDMICTSHGVIWRKDPLQIVNQYLAWADNYQENQITIVYDTMWNATRRMAEAIAAGIQMVDKDVIVKLCNAANRIRMTSLRKSSAQKPFFWVRPPSITASSLLLAASWKW